MGITTAVGPQAAVAQELAGNGGPDISIPRLLSALVLVIAVAVAFAMVLRGQRHGARLSLVPFSAALIAKRQIAVIETRLIAPHTHLCLVACGEVEYLILCSQSGSSVLTRCSLVRSHRQGDAG